MAYRVYDSTFQYKHGTVPSPAKLAEISSIQFGAFSSKDIEKYSVCPISTGTGFDRGVPAKGGFLDPRLGTVEYSFVCETCKMDNFHCAGHWGHLELARPVYNWGYVKIVHKILQSVCHTCYKLRLPDTDKKVADILNRVRIGPNRLLELASVLSGTRECKQPDCQKARQPERLRIDTQNLTLSREDTAAGAENFLAQDALNVLDRISDDVAEALGFVPRFTHPRDLILVRLPVPPPHVRPSIQQVGGDRADDDLTHFLVKIFDHNNKLRHAIASRGQQHKIDQLTRLLQYTIARMMDNQKEPPLENRSKRALKGIRERLKSKQGRVRCNLMGKRVNFCARSVITADPNLYLDEVGVPQAVAMRLTFAERVTRFNITRLRQAVRNAAFVYPGAHTVRLLGGGVYPLDSRAESSKHHERAAQLREGDTVERHMLDGDPVLFNRQPTLHRMSMMGHRARVLPFSTFRLNLSVTAPYNADFDGDEMNLHMPQSLLTRTELMMMMCVPRNLLSMQRGKPVMGLTQDSLLGIFKMTGRDAFLDRALFFNCLLTLDLWLGAVPMPAIIKPTRWTGKQAISVIFAQKKFGINLLPDAKNISREKEPSAWAAQHNKLLTHDDGDVRIHQGRILTGSMSSKLLSKGGEVVHHVILDSTYNTAAMFLTSLQRMVDFWLVHNGHTIGLSDCVVDEGTWNKTQEIVQSAQAKVSRLIEEAREKRLKRNVGRTYAETFEDELAGTLNKARSDTGTETKKKLRRRNNFKVMSDAGSKGNSDNIAQISCCGGQQQVNGKRLTFHFHNRSLPHFTQHDHGSTSRGFVASNFLLGLTPAEFFFSAQSGRESLIDTACKTAETGYIQRKLVKALEDLVVRYDGTVRDSYDRVVQFSYGEDGLDPMRVENAKIPLADMDNKKFSDTYRYEYSVSPDGHAVADHQFGRGYLAASTIALYTSDSALNEDDLEPTLYPYQRFALPPVELAPPNDQRYIQVSLRAVPPLPPVLDMAVDEAPTPQWGVRLTVDDAILTTFGNGGHFYRSVDDGNGLDMLGTVDDVMATLATVKVCRRPLVSGAAETPVRVLLVAQSFAEEDYRTSSAYNMVDISDDAFTGTGNVLTTTGIDVVFAQRYVLSRQLTQALHDEYEALERDRTELLRGACFVETDGDGDAVVPEYAPPTLFARRVICADSYCMPVNINRLITNEQGSHRVTSQSSTANPPSRLLPQRVIVDVEELIRKIISLGKNPDNTKLFVMYIRATLNSRRVLREFRLEQAAFRSVLWNIQTAYEGCVVQAGEAVGVVAAQSMGEPATQMTLNTFHFAGNAAMNVTLGVPRLREIINLARLPRTPMMDIPLSARLSRVPISAQSWIVNRIRDDICRETLGTHLVCEEIWFEPDKGTSVIEEDAEACMIFHAELLLAPEEERALFNAASSWVIRLVFEEGCAIGEAATAAIKGKHPDWYVTWHVGAKSDIVRIRVNGADEAELLARGVGGREWEHFLLDRKQEARNLHGLELRGIDRIGRARFDRANKKADMGMRYFTRGGSLEDGNKMHPPDGDAEVKKDDLVGAKLVEVAGSNLLKVMAHPLVDATRVGSNDICEVYETLGVEAARTLMMEQIQAVYSMYGLYINSHHYTLLVDAMTFTGGIMPINRHGINRRDIGPMMRSSFEETVEIFYSAAAFSECDNLKGVSSSIMVGASSQVGTGVFDVLVAPEPLKAALRKVNTANGDDDLDDGDDAALAEGRTFGFVPEPTTMTQMTAGVDMNMRTADLSYTGCVDMFDDDDDMTTGNTGSTRTGSGGHGGAMGPEPALPYAPRSFGAGGGDMYAPLSVMSFGGVRSGIAGRSSAGGTGGYAAMSGGAASQFGAGGAPSSRGAPSAGGLSVASSGYGAADGSAPSSGRYGSGSGGSGSSGGGYQSGSSGYGGVASGAVGGSAYAPQSGVGGGSAYAPRSAAAGGGYGAAYAPRSAAANAYAPRSAAAVGYAPRSGAAGGGGGYAPRSGAAAAYAPRSGVGGAAAGGGYAPRSGAAAGYAPRSGVQSFAPRSGAAAAVSAGYAPRSGAAAGGVAGGYAPSSLRPAVATGHAVSSAYAGLSAQAPPMEEADKDEAEQ